MYGNQTTFTPVGKNIHRSAVARIPMIHERKMNQDNPARRIAVPQSKSTGADDTSQPNALSKKQKAAEARYKYELLQEERLLRDHLAEFWETSNRRPDGEDFRYSPDILSIHDDIGNGHTD